MILQSAHHNRSARFTTVKLLRDPEAAKDAAQDVFVRLVRDMDRLEDARALPWIYRVATNHCRLEITSSGRSPFS